MTPDEHKNAARELLEAEHTGIQIGLLTQRYPQMDMDDAYAIQKSIFEAKMAQGRRLVGWKIGLTSNAISSNRKPLSGTSILSAYCMAFEVKPIFQPTSCLPCAILALKMDFWIA